MESQQIVILCAFVLPYKSVNFFVDPLLHQMPLSTKSCTKTYLQAIWAKKVREFLGPKYKSYLASVYLKPKSSNTKWLRFLEMISSISAIFKKYLLTAKKWQKMIKKRTGIVLLLKWTFVRICTDVLQKGDWFCGHCFKAA